MAPPQQSWCVVQILAEVANIREEQREESQRKEKIKTRVVGAFWSLIDKNDSIVSKAEKATAKAQRVWKRVGGCRYTPLTHCPRSQVLINENKAIKERYAKCVGTRWRRGVALFPYLTGHPQGGT